MANISSLNFDASQVPPAEAFEALPAGTYKAVITKTEMKDNRAKNGVFLEVELQIVDGEHANRKVWDRINLLNPSATAVEIGKRTLSAICHAVHVMRPSDTSELHNIPLIIKVGVEKRSDTDDMSNVVKGYVALNSVEVSQPQTQAPAGGKPSWAR